MIALALAVDKVPVIQLLKQSHLAAGFAFDQSPTGFACPFDPAYAERLFLAHLTPSALCLVFKPHDEARGVLMATATEHPFGPVWLARETVWFISPGYRGSAVVRMLDAYEAWAAERGRLFAGMAGMGADPDVAKLYRRRGYVTAETHFLKALWRMAIFTAAATALAGTALFAGTFFATTTGIALVASTLGIIAGIGLNYVAKALAGTPEEPAAQDAFGTQVNLVSGGAVPRSFGLGRYVTAGSLVYANYWGDDFAGETPNAYLTQVIALSDMPGEQLQEVWVSGEKVTLRTDLPTQYGFPVQEYWHNGVDGGSVGVGYYLWIKFYDGTQTTADTFLTDIVSSADRPYGPTRVGKGVCYAICTSLVQTELFSGFPTFKFGLSGIALYDPTKDDTNGGTGPHRYGDPTTWGGDGDDLPAVQAYNILRGIRYEGDWLFGLQNMSGPARLPTANWNLQIGKCRALIEGEDGDEPTYRAGGQININVQPANAVEALLTACQGRLSEIGGFYKIHLGAPDDPVFAWTDADLLSDEEQVYRPFFGLADSVNGIQGTYPDPAQGWETMTAPAIFRTDLEVRDGNRRLMANPQFALVPYPAQVQRLQKSGLEEAQRARTHALPFPPGYWIVEPGDVGQWTSARNGYDGKLFRVDSAVDRANLDCLLNLTEIDPSDYDWDQAADFKPVQDSGNPVVRPPPQGVVAWSAEGIVLYDSGGLGRQAAIRIVWDGTLLGITGIQYQVRRKADGSEVTKGNTDQFQSGALIIAAGILPLTEYEVRGQYIPTAPRPMLWSDWITVLTPDVVSADLPAWIANQVTSVFDQFADRLIEVEQRFATLHSKVSAQDYEVFRDVRHQLTARSDVAMAEIATVELVAIDATEAVAELETSVTAEFGEVNASVTENATAIADINEWAAASYSVTLNVSGYATGFQLVNGGPGFSTTTFVTDNFLIAAPGVSGGAAVPIFAVANVGGAPKVALRGDMIVDGSVTALKIKTGDITSDSGVIGALGVKSLSIQDNAVTVPSVQNYGPVACTINTTVVLASFNLSIDTTGLAGKSIPIYAIATFMMNQVPASGSAIAFGPTLTINGVSITGPGGAFQSQSHTLSNSVNVVATGGVMSIPVTCSQYVANIGTYTCYGSLFAMAAKR